LFTAAGRNSVKEREYSSIVSTFPAENEVPEWSVIPDRESAGQTRHKGTVKGNLKYVFN
jgi:hypothetical protein